MIVKYFQSACARMATFTFTDFVLKLISVYRCKYETKDHETTSASQRVASNVDFLRAFSQIQSHVFIYILS